MRSQFLSTNWLFSLLTAFCRHVTRALFCRAGRTFGTCWQVQGIWERKTGEDVPALHHAATKEVNGTHEVVTYYGAGDEVIRAHEVDFKLENRDGVKIFTFSNWTGTAGPDKGPRGRKPSQPHLSRGRQTSSHRGVGFSTGPGAAFAAADDVGEKAGTRRRGGRGTQGIAGNMACRRRTKAAPIPRTLPAMRLTFNGDDFRDPQGKTGLPQRRCAGRPRRRCPSRST